MRIPGICVLMVFAIATAALAAEAPRDTALRTMSEAQMTLAQLQQSQAASLAAFDAALQAAVRLNAAAAAVTALAARMNTQLPADLVAQVKQMQTASTAFNLQYLQLQQKMQDESRRFTMLSNILKTKHDTATNSIANIR